MTFSVKINILFSHILPKLILLLTFYTHKTNNKHINAYKNKKTVLCKNL